PGGRSALLGARSARAACHQRVAATMSTPLQTDTPAAPDAAAMVAPAMAADQTPLRQLVTSFAQSRLALAGLAVLVLLVLVASFAPWVAPQDPYDLARLDLMDSRLAPGEESSDGSMRFLLGSDAQGRDMVSAILYGL